MQKKSFFVILLAAWLLIASAVVSPVHAQAVTLQLGLVLDNTGSITGAGWTIIVNGVATAVTNNMPHDGTVELTVVDFSDLLSTTVGLYTYWARVDVSHTVITAANFAAVATTISSIPYSGGTTSMADGVFLAWLDMVGSPNFQPNGRQVINLATDGVPNEPWHYTPGATGGDDTDVTAARNAAVLGTGIYAGGLDELDAEAIGISPNVNWMRDNVVWPQPGTIAPPFTAGWVQQVADAAAFANAMANKFQQIFHPPIVIPEYPLGLAVLAVFMVVAYGVIRRKT